MSNLVRCKEFPITELAVINLHQPRFTFQCQRVVFKGQCDHIHIKETLVKLSCYTQLNL